jgi:transcriptional regulator with XRE-family HTH domain
MQTLGLPTTQGALIRLVRGSVTQAEFAKRLGVDRSSLSRYESEDLGAPTAVINYCLRALAGLPPEAAEAQSELQRALSHARQVVTELEAAARGESRPRSRAKRDR